jgi:hypothetical protein
VNHDGKRQNKRMNGNFNLYIGKPMQELQQAAARVEQRKKSVKDAATVVAEVQRYGTSFGGLQAKVPAGNYA